MEAAKTDFVFCLCMNFSTLSSEKLLGKMARLPLELVPREMVIPIPLGRLRGKRWIAGSAIHRCWLGLYEYEKQQAIAREVRPDSVFYDVGANVGFYSLLASSLVGRGKVFAFEPVPRNLGYLRRHLALNHAANVEVLALALSDREGAASFQIEKTGFMGHLSIEGDLAVSTATLDSLVKEGRVLPPNYIKMDIEGAELLALRGARETFERYRPVLFLATHGREVHRACCQLLESWGYECECQSVQEGGHMGYLGEVIARFPEFLAFPRRSSELIREMTESTSEIGNAFALPNAVDESAAAAKAVCFLCGGPLEVTMTGVTDNRLGTPGEYEIQRCVRCALEQTFPVPTLAELKQLYETHYNFGGERDTLYTKSRERFLFSFLYRLWTGIDDDPAFYRRTGKGRLLDVGCNEGRGLRIYARNGFQAEGLDLNEAAATVAREAGLTVHTRLLEEFHPEAPYDVVVLSNVMEHTLDPRKMLQDVRRILAKGGQVWISCPNNESWLRRVFGKSWINWHVPFHTFHFSAKVLGRLLGETGYGGVEIRTVTPAPWVAQSMITYLFARKNEKNRQLRNPFLVGLFMLFVRFLLFPVLWLGNRRGQGDCLLAMATRA